MKTSFKRNIKNNSQNNEINNIQNTKTFDTLRNNPEHSLLIKPRKKKNQKASSQKNIYENIYERNQYYKNEIFKNTMTNYESKLAPVNYVKPLYYLLKNRLVPINKQFLGFRVERNFKYNIPKTRNNDVKYKTIACKNEEINDMSDSKYKSQNLKNSKNTLSLSQNFENFGKNKILMNKMNSGVDNNEKECDDLKNKKAILIQACFRGYLARKVIYNSLAPYSKFRIDLHTLERLKRYKNIFFNRLKEIKEEYDKNKNRYDNNSPNYINVIFQDNETINKDISNNNVKNKDKNNNSVNNNREVNKQKSNNDIQKYDNNIVIDNQNSNTINDVIYNYKVRIFNKKCVIFKNDDFIILSCYPNNYDKLRNNNNNNYELINKESYNKEKELYEQKLKKIIEENNRIKEKIKELEQYENKFKNIEKERENLNNEIKELKEKKNKYIDLEEKYNNLQKENDKINNINSEINNKLKALEEENNKNKEENEE